METIFSQVNLLAVLVSVIVYFALGALWYSPVMFAKPWMNAIGKAKEDLETSPVVYISTFLAILIVVFILAVLVILIDTNTIRGGAFVGAVTGIGFSLTTTGINNMYAGRSLSLTLITSGYHIVGFTLAGIILANWK